MVKTVTPLPLYGPVSTQASLPVPQAGDAADPADDDAASAEEAKQAARAAANSKGDAFEGAARLKIENQAASLANALNQNPSSADAAQLLGSFVKSALLAEQLRLNGAAGPSSGIEALQGLRMPEVDPVLEGALAQLIQLAQGLGQPLTADVLTLEAMLNGQPASLLDSLTNPTILKRALALANEPLKIFILIATGQDIGEQSKLSPRTAYWVRGTFIDANNEHQVRLSPGGPDGAPSNDEAMLAQALIVPFAAVQRAMLLALIGDPRIDVPYAHALDEAAGPGQANCCMFAHGMGAARGAASISEPPTTLSQQRCRSCPYARQQCLP